MFIPIENKDIPIVVIDNFLPESYLNEVFSNIIDLKDFFSKSHWTSGIGEDINPNCTGEDLWLPFSQEEDERLFRVSDNTTKPYTAVVKIEYTVNNGAFSSSDFIILNI